MSGIPLIEYVKWDFRKGGWSFENWLDYVMNHPEGYLFKGDDYFMMGWAQKKLAGRFKDAPGPFWLVFYSRTQNGFSLARLCDMTPYPLPYIGFMRGLQGKKGLKYYSLGDLHRICESLGN